RRGSPPERRDAVVARGGYRVVVGGARCGGAGRAGPDELGIRRGLRLCESGTGRTNTPEAPDCLQRQGLASLSEICELGVGLIWYRHPGTGCGRGARSRDGLNGPNGVENLLRSLPSVLRRRPPTAPAPLPTIRGSMLGLISIGSR
ncbi:hypothetical protein THAOC_11466, partial [Thalassiosira oceanica]